MTFSQRTLNYMSDISKQNIKFFIDVVGTCNLKCPTCPVGNSLDVKNPKGIMSPELLDKIMAKAVSECNVVGVGLHNWTEPLLHPQLPRLINVVQSYGVPCEISTNLNLLANPKELMAANPHSIYISVSGFEQSTYGITHKKGDIELVKKNIHSLVLAQQQVESKTILTIVFHRYKNNHEDETKLKKFANEKGIGFIPVWAMMMPLEKVLSYAISDPTEKLQHVDFEIARRLALPLDEALEAARKYSDRPCKLLNNQVTLNVEGDVALCCAVYDMSKYKVANFLTSSFAEIQAVRKTNKLCYSCTKFGGHIYATYGAPEFDSIAMNNYLS